MSHGIAPYMTGNIFTLHPCRANNITEEPQFPCTSISTDTSTSNMQINMES